MDLVFKVNRRQLVMTGVIGCAGVGVGLALGMRLGERSERWRKRIPARDQPFAPSVFLAIDRSDLITIWVAKTEMGQGVHTSLPMIIAEELDADWRSIRIEHAIANENYGDQLTGVSTSVRRSFDELRSVGATARQMLVTAAAHAWGALPEACRAEESRITHVPTGRRVSYGDVTELAALLPVPRQSPLKPTSQFKIIGHSMPRLDAPEKVDGRARFGIDVMRPGLLTAVVARSPAFGGKVVSFDAAPAKKIAGVRAVLEIESGVAVLAEGFWPAIEGRRALDVTWDKGAHAELSSERVIALLREAADGPAFPSREIGNAAAEISASSSGRTIEAEYALPYLAHATMETPNCTAYFSGNKCEIWAPTQAPQASQRTAAEITGLDASAIVVHTTLAGTGFGRKVEQDMISEAVELTQRTRRPVKVIWAREDDLRHDHYRPAALHRLRATLDDTGSPRAWVHRVVSPSILASQGGIQGVIDPLTVEGAKEVPYEIQNLTVEYASPRLPVPLGFWRSVGHSHNAFAVECFVDEIAHQAKMDPLLLRRHLLASAPRHLAVLDLAASRAGFGTPISDGRGMGIAVHASFASYVAMVAEVSVDADRSIRVHRIVAAVDCGTIIHPKIVESQIESGVAFGLSAALFQEITFENGRVRQSNFHDYPVVRMSSMPRVEVHIVESSESPGGVGEIGVPPVAPAVANAIFHATRTRLRTMPLRL